MRTLKIPKYLQYFVSTLWGCHHLQTPKKPSVHSQFSPLSFSNKTGRTYSKCAQKWYDFRKALKYLHHLHKVSAVPRNLTSPPPADAAIRERDRTGGLGRRCLGGCSEGLGELGVPMAVQGHQEGHRAREAELGEWGRKRPPTLLLPLFTLSSFESLSPLCYQNCHCFYLSPDCKQLMSFCHIQDSHSREWMVLLPASLYLPH